MATDGSTATKTKLLMPTLAALGDRRQRLLEELAPARFRGDEQRVTVLERELEDLEDEVRRTIRGGAATVPGMRESREESIPPGSRRC